MLLLTSNFLLLLAVSCNSQKSADAWNPFAAKTEPSTETRISAHFDMDGVKGEFKCVQPQPMAPTTCEYDLTGLKDNNNLYHVHVKPVPLDQIHNPQACGDATTGGHHNPHNITEKLPPKSAPFDKYELGDLSGKHGPLLKVAGQEDRYRGSFVDDKLPLSGLNSIVGRSIVIHKNDGKRWVCAPIH